MPLPQPESRFRIPMRSGFAAVLAVVLLPGIGSSEEKPAIDAPANRAGYSLGYQIGGDLKRQDAEIDAAALLRGLRDGLQGTDPSLPPEEMNAILVGLKKGIEASERKGWRHDAERYREEGREFLAAFPNVFGVGVKCRVHGKQARHFAFDARRLARFMGQLHGC